MREFRIGQQVIRDESPAWVIAEIGNTHNGSVRLGCELIHACANAGVDAIKLQKRDLKTLYSQALFDAPYEHENSFGPTYGTHREALELDAPAYSQLLSCAYHWGLTGFATAFDEASVDFLMAQQVPVIKLASAALTDEPLQIYLAHTQIPIILSTGGGTIQDIDAAVERITRINPNLALLHCTAAYPCAFDELNLRCIPMLRDRYPDLVIGFSGHDDGISMSLVAYTLGARIIEKHVTLNHTFKGTDHVCSLEPEGLTRLCRDLKRAHTALGDGIKRFYDSERKPLAKMRRVPTSNGWKITGTGA